MRVGYSSRDAQERCRIATEAARIMMEQSVPDFHSAKRKAVERLGLDGRRNLPSNTEIQQALRERHRLYEGDAHNQRLRALRAQALGVMRTLHPFHPHLVGSVLEGVVGEHAAVNLHVFADSPDEITAHLAAHEIPFEVSERRLRYPRARRETHPLLRLWYPEVVIELTVFAREGLARPPLSPVNGRPMTRAGVSAVERLLAQDGLPSAD